MALPNPKLFPKFVSLNCLARIVLDFSFKKIMEDLDVQMIKPYIKRFSFKISYFVINIFKNKLQITSLKFGDI